MKRIWRSAVCAGLVLAAASGAEASAGALQAAARIPGPAGAALADAARQSFVSGMDLGLLIASIVVAAAACVVLLALPQRPAPPATPTQAPAQLASRT